MKNPAHSQKLLFSLCVKIRNRGVATPLTLRVCGSPPYPLSLALLCRYRSRKAASFRGVCYNASKKGQIMSQSEALKIELDFLKVSFSALLIALFGIVSYAFINFESLSFEMFIVLCVGLALVSVALFIVVGIAVKRIKELKKLKKGN